MKVVLTERFKKRVTKRVKKNSELERKIVKQIQLLRQNPHHPSLKLHKLEGERRLEYAVWVEGNLRLTCQIDGEVIVLTDLITHDEY